MYTPSFNICHTRKKKLLPHFLVPTTWQFWNLNSFQSDKKLMCSIVVVKHISSPKKFNLQYSSFIFHTVYERKTDSKYEMYWYLKFTQLGTNTWRRCKYKGCPPSASPYFTHFTDTPVIICKTFWIWMTLISYFFRQFLKMLGTNVWMFCGSTLNFFLQLDPNNFPHRFVFQWWRSLCQPFTSFHENDLSSPSTHVQYSIYIFILIIIALARSVTNIRTPVVENTVGCSKWVQYYYKKQMLPFIQILLTFLLTYSIPYSYQPILVHWQQWSLK